MTSRVSPNQARSSKNKAEPHLTNATIVMHSPKSCLRGFRSFASAMERMAAHISAPAQDRAIALRVAGQCLIVCSPTGSTPPSVDFQLLPFFQSGDTCKILRRSLARYFAIRITISVSPTQGAAMEQVACSPVNCKSKRSLSKKLQRATIALKSQHIIAR